MSDLFARLAKWLGFRDSSGDDSPIHRFDDAVDAGDVASASDLLKQYPDAFDEQRLSRLAGMQLERGFIDDAAHTFTMILRNEGNESTEVRVCNDAYMDPVRGVNRDSYIKTLDDVFIDTEYWGIIDNHKVYVKETYGRAYQASHLVGGRVSPDGARYILALDAPEMTITEPCILLASTRNYSHWILRSLPRLFLVDERPDLKNIRYLVNDELLPFHKEYLELLGIGEDALIKAPANSLVFCRKIHVPTQMWNNRNVVKGVDWLRKQVDQYITPENKANELIFVSRRECSQRILVNEEQLYHALQPYGFRRIVPGEMTVREQIEMFSSARIIVAAHGAALTNIMYTWPSCSVVEISSSNIRHMATFRWLAQERRQNISTIYSDDYDISEADKARIEKMHWDYRVDIDEVVSAVLDYMPESVGTH